MKEVQQEFLVTKIIQEVEVEKETDVNFVGVYVTVDDKVSNFPRGYHSISFSVVGFHSVPSSVSLATD